jgi:hypothetical protein
MKLLRPLLFPLLLCVNLFSIEVCGQERMRPPAAFDVIRYDTQIESYRASYEKVREAGKDKSLVFPDWLHPTREDRTLVYRKGAYVLHLLREELGEKDFWAGIRLYTRTYFGKSVTTADFQAAMERASGKSLREFFSKWVYLTAR